MANNKTGFNYYSIDTDRYLDMKIKRLKKDFGCAGIAIYDYILCEIYRVKGCFIEWDKSTVFDVADYFGVKESLVNEIVNYCGVVGLFDKVLLARGILTSLSIQNRYSDWCKKAKRSNCEIPKKAKIQEESHIIQEESPIIQEECDIIQEVCDKESKVKKGKERKEGNYPFPKIEDVGDLPRGYISSTIEILKVTAQIILKKEDVLTLWDAFKLQNVTGKYYPDEEEVFRHFSNWVRKQDYKKIENHKIMVI